MAADNNTEHWQRLSRVEEDLDELKPQVASLKTDVSYIRHSIEQLVLSQHKPFQWGAIVSSLGVLVVVLGGYTTLIAAPLTQATRDNAASIQAAEEFARKQAVLNETAVQQTQWHKTWLSSVDDQMNELVEENARLRERISRIEGAK